MSPLRAPDPRGSWENVGSVRLRPRVLDLAATAELQSCPCPQCRLDQADMRIGRRRIYPSGRAQSA